MSTNRDEDGMDIDLYLDAFGSRAMAVDSVPDRRTPDGIVVGTFSKCSFGYWKTDDHAVYWVMLAERASDRCAFFVTVSIPASIAEDLESSGLARILNYVEPKVLNAFMALEEASIKTPDPTPDCIGAFRPRGGNCDDNCDVTRWRKLCPAMRVVFEKIAIEVCEQVV